MEDLIIKQLQELIDIPFLLLVNLSTYWINKLNELIKPTKTWNKRIYLIIVIIILNIVYYKLNLYGVNIIITSMISPVSWSWIIKPLCKYFNIDYKK